MRAAVLKHQLSEVCVRSGSASDLDALVDLDTKVFASDRMSRRSIRHFLTTSTAELIVAELDQRIVGWTVILFRPKSAIARLYSIAVAPLDCGCGVGPSLLAAAEETAQARGCHSLRLEVHERNLRAIALYHKAGYREFGRHHQYYGDKCHALRFEKALMRSAPARTGGGRTR